MRQLALAFLLTLSPACALDLLHVGGRVSCAFDCEGLHILIPKDDGSIESLTKDEYDVRAADGISALTHDLTIFTAKLAAAKTIQEKRRAARLIKDTSKTLAAMRDILIGVTSCAR
jgi:hypothetical protein